jgi:hypothetical protein
MMLLWLLLLSSLLRADYPPQWSAAYKVSQQHEFYAPNEIIAKPAGSWQLLFALTYWGQNVTPIKDCIFFKVPGEEPGVLKYKTTVADGNCEDYLQRPGDRQWEGIKALQFSIADEQINLSLTYSGFRQQRWRIQLDSRAGAAVPERLMSSAQFKVGRIIVLAHHPGTLDAAAMGQDGEVCHEVRDNCEVVAASTCSDCQHGWYEVPNGCPVGPKFCGAQSCGGKNQPACRRGMKWQRQKKIFDCRQDQSFAYCSSGFNLQCEGAHAYCR